MKLSNNFELWEFEQSQTAVRKGIDNRIVDPVHLENIKALVTDVLQPLRTLTNRPITVSSGYRSPKLNTAVGGSKTSQHCFGEAVDFMFIGVSAIQGCRIVLNSGLEFDQLIYEGTWIHLSYRKGQNRKQVLTAVFNPGKKTTYLNGLVE